MYQMTYSCVFLVARKPPKCSDNSRAHSRAGSTSAKGGDRDPLSVPQRDTGGCDQGGGHGPHDQSVLQTLERIQSVADSTVTSKTQSVTGTSTQS